MGERTRIELRLLKHRYKADLQQEYQKGWREGWLAAWSEGWQEGHEVAAQYLLKRLLKHRFGEPEAESLARISKLLFKQQAELAEALLDFTSLKHLIEWLDTHTNSNLEGQTLCEKSLS